MEENGIRSPVVRGVGRPKKPLDSERRFRRDIANTHERKRMQSINDGILTLRSLLKHKDIDKLSKATVLLRSAEYLIQLENKLSLLIEENFRLKCLTKDLIQKSIRTSLTTESMVVASQLSNVVNTTKAFRFQQNLRVNDDGDDDHAIDLSLHSNK